MITQYVSLLSQRISVRLLFLRMMSRDGRVRVDADRREHALVCQSRGGDGVHGGGAPLIVGVGALVVVGVTPTFLGIG